MTISVNYPGDKKKYSLKRVNSAMPIFYKKGTHHVIKEYEDDSKLPDNTIPDNYAQVGKPFHDAEGNTVCMYENIEDVFARRTSNEFGEKIIKVL